MPSTGNGGKDKEKRTMDETKEESLEIIKKRKTRERGYPSRTYGEDVVRSLHGGKWPPSALILCYGSKAPAATG